MDGVSSAASVIAIATVAVQLADGMKKLCEFWSSIKEAPDDIHSIATGLGMLSASLTEIAHEAELQQPDPTLTRVLKECSVEVNLLTSIVDDFEPGFASSSSRVRRWTALKAVFKTEKLKKFRDFLDSTKTTLLLIQGNHSRRLSRTQYENHQRSLATITQGITELRMKNSSEIISAFSGSPSDTHDHTMALRTEISRMASRMPTPLYQSAFESGMNKALEEILNGVRDGGSVEGPVPGDREPRLGSRTLILGLEKSLSRQQTWRKRTIKTQNAVLQSFLGTIYIRSKTNVLENIHSQSYSINDGNQYEHETFFSISPARWLLNLGFGYGLHVGLSKSTIQGWKHTLSPFCQVPDDAMIFEFCKEGNISGVRTLLSRGQASVRDTDSRGRTALYSAVESDKPRKFAAETVNPQLCKLLIEGGADKDARTFDKRYRVFGAQGNPLLAAAGAYKPTRTIKAAPLIDTFRLFTDSMDFSESKSDGWAALLQLCYSANRRVADRKEVISTLLWVLGSSSSEIKDNIDDWNIFYLMRYMLYEDEDTEEVTDLLLRISPDTIDARDAEGGYTALHRCIAGIAWGSIRDIRYLLEKGANPHVVGKSNRFSPLDETPTSLSMYSSSAFMVWRSILQSSVVNIEDFVIQELKHRPLRVAGWHKDTLLALFCLPYIECPTPTKCDECYTLCEEEASHMVEPRWLFLLEQIKNRSYSFELCERSRYASDQLGDEFVIRKIPSGNSEESFAADEYDEEENIQTVRNQGQEREFEEEGEEGEGEEEKFFDSETTFRSSSSNHSSNEDPYLCMQCWLDRKAPEDAPCTYAY